jgi:DNA-binding CsgD family transcriptional regulator
MTDDKQLDHIIGVIYETVLEPSRWSEAVELCGLYAGGIAGQLCTVNKADLSAELFLMAGEFSQPAATVYEKNIPIDPRSEMFSEMIIQKWLCCHHFYDQNFVNHNEFYQDFLIIHGVRYGMAAMIDETTDYITTFGSIRAVGQQPFGDTNQLAAQRFGSHLQRALRLQKHTQSLQTKAELGARAIDALALPMLIVDGKAVILHLNVGAERLLNSPVYGLTGKAGHLFSTHPDQQNKLKDLIAKATGYPAVGGAMFFPDKDLRQVFVTPLPAASPFAQDWQSPLALVLVMDANQNLSSLQLLGALYNLSPAELRVASALLNGNSPEQYAQQAAVSVNTVRTQLKSLFNKTNTSRQSELVAILSRMPPLQN